MSLAWRAGITSRAVDDCYISNMLRVVLGLLKGDVVGGALGFAALKLGVGGGAAGILTYALIGGLVGMVCGKPPWRQDTFWTSAIKGLVGVGVGIGLFWLGRKLLGGMHVSLPASLGAPPDRSIAELPIILGPLVGAIWGAIVEADDGGSASTADKNKPPKAA